MLRTCVLLLWPPCVAPVVSLLVSRRRSRRTFRLDPHVSWPRSRGYQVCPGWWPIAPVVSRLVTLPVSRLWPRHPSLWCPGLSRRCRGRCFASACAPAMSRPVFRLWPRCPCRNPAGVPVGRHRCPGRCIVINTQSCSPPPQPLDHPNVGGTGGEHHEISRSDTKHAVSSRFTFAFRTSMCSFGCICSVCLYVLLYLVISSLTPSFSISLFPRIPPPVVSPIVVLFCFLNSFGVAVWDGALRGCAPKRSHCGPSHFCVCVCLKRLLI